MADGTEGAAPATGGGGGGGKLVVPLLAVNSLLVAGVLALVLLRGGGGKEAAAHDAGGRGEKAVAGAHGEKAPPLPLPGPTLKLPDFVIHLRDADADRYARMSFEVEVGTEEDKSRVADHLPRRLRAATERLEQARSRVAQQLGREPGAEDLATALAALPERLQLVMSLHYEEELTYREIAKVLGVSEPRVCQLHREAVEAVRAAVGGGRVGR